MYLAMVIPPAARRAGPAAHPCYERASPILTRTQETTHERSMLHQAAVYRSANARSWSLSGGISVEGCHCGIRVERLVNDAPRAFDLNHGQIVAVPHPCEP